MLVAPQAADQFGNADRLIELGVAIRVDTATSTAEELRSALLTLTPSRVRQIQREVRAEGGAGRAADLLGL
jgi:UDP:flavonoid glycosyltransferase YjiC (YdhE family)